MNKKKKKERERMQTSQALNGLRGDNCM